LKRAIALTIAAPIAFGAFTATAEASTVSQAQSYARSRVSYHQYRCLLPLWTRESSWRWNARNPSSGAYGIPQSYPASKMRSAGADWRTNYKTQIRWGVSYVNHRYGSPCNAWAFWQRHHWY
jgi:hypothetical protein